jgi:hypothetical protein
MHSKESFASLRRILLGATSFTAAIVMAGGAQAQERPTGSEESPSIIVRNDLNPNAPPPGGVLDTADILMPDGTRGPGLTVGQATGVNGVGQMTVRPNPATTGLSLCTGTLINPRTVLFAAHCVNTRPAEAYGKNGVANGLNPNGTPIAFGFGADNLPAVRQWLGLTSGTGPADANPALRDATNAARALYSVEQVWYDPRSLRPGAAGFLEADVALATLDTPAFDIPTWTLLFSPLTGPTHSVSTGYGTNGTSNTAQNGPGCPAGNPGGTCGGIDFRRRAVENMLSVLASLDDRDDFLFGPAPADLVQSLYMQDFDSPEGEAAYNPAAGRFDFDLFNGSALAREGTTAGGDSGGPLIVDKKFNKPVLAGELSGGSRFFGAQRFGTYGTHNFYQPLFLFWDAIVANNSYVYAGTKAGDGAWEDASRWVQLMDPNYAVERNGALVNDLPDTPALGVSGNTVKFGQICFLNDCIDAAEDETATDAPVGSGAGLVIAGGPGSTNFVANNVVANPKQGIKARYFDVTLSKPGATTLSSAVTIDRFTMDGKTKLDVKSAGGSLGVLGEYTQIAGWTNVDGLIRSGGDALIVSGLLSGSGTFKAPFLTVGAAVVAPGGADTIGVLTIDGNTILSSGSALFIDAGRAGADKLAVTGSLTLSQNANGQGPSLVLNKAQGAAPRHGQSFTIAESTGLTGTFGQVFAFQGVLRPELTYSATSVIANLRAGSLANQIGASGPTELAFARALDQLRGNSYNALSGLYGVVDLMDGATLARTLAGMSPSGIAGEALSLQEKQSRIMIDAVSNRLSTLGSGAMSGTLSIVGSPDSVVAMQMGGTGFASGSARFGSAQSLVPTAGRTMALPRGFSGFISGGVGTAASTFGNNRAELAGQRNWHVGMGLEVAVSEEATIGTAFGVAQGVGRPGGETSRTESRMTQAAFYGSYRFGGGVYLAGLASAEASRTDIDRQASLGDAAFAITGATGASRYLAMAEAGVNLGLGRGLTLTPRAALGYFSYQLSGFRENGGELALHVDDLQLSRLEAKFGVKFAGSASLGKGWRFVPQLQADFVRGLSGANDGLSVRFANAPDVAFLLPLAGGDTDWAEVKGGMKLTNGPLELGAGLQSAIGRSDVSDDRAVADFTFRF